MKRGHPTLKAEAAFDRFYAELPTLDCKGLCSESCGPIAMTKPEWDRIRRRLHRTPKGDASLTCPMLLEDRCTVYTARPTLCRLWGVVDTMPCPHGCVPSRWLTAAEGHRVLAEAGYLAEALS